MLFLSGIIKAVGEGLSLAKVLADPANREKAFHLAVQKNAKKALDTAEKMMELWDEHANLLPPKSKKEYARLKRTFNLLD